MVRKVTNKLPRLAPLSVYIYENAKKPFRILLETVSGCVCATDFFLSMFYSASVSLFVAVSGNTTRGLNVRASSCSIHV